MKIKKVDLSDPKQRALFERELEKQRKKTEPIIKAIRDSQRITAADLAITINTK